MQQYLASRLNEARDAARRATRAQEKALAESEAAVQERDVARSQQQVAERGLADQQSNHAAQLAAALAKAQQEHVDALVSLRGEMERARQQGEQKLVADVERLTLQHTQVEKAYKALEATRTQLDLQVTALTGKLATSEGARAAAESQADRAEKALHKLQAQHGELQQAHATSSIEAARAKADVTGLRAVVQTLESRAKEAEGVRDGAVETLRESRANAEKIEKRLNVAEGEVDKGNQIIDRLQGDLKAARAKLKLKAAVIAQQEHTLVEASNKVERLTREAAHLKTSLEREEHASMVANTRAEEQKNKLDEAQALLASNGQMIQWLNAQITEAQLGRHAGGSARLSTAFRSTILPMTTTTTTTSGGGGGSTGTAGGGARGSSSSPLAPRRDVGANAGGGTTTVVAPGAASSFSSLAAKYALAADMPIPTERRR